MWPGSDAERAEQAEYQRLERRRQLLIGMFDLLPPTDRPFPAEEREAFIEAMRHMFTIVYRLPAECTPPPDMTTGDPPTRPDPSVPFRKA